MTREWTSPQARWAAVSFALLALALGCSAGWRLGHLFDQPDASMYLALAAGQPTMLPFASRQLDPLIARALVHTLHVSIQTGFLLEGILAIVFLAGASGFLAMRPGGPRWLLPALAGMSFWALQFNSLAMPDLLYAALLAGFLLLLQSQQFMAAALMMCPLMVSRESTMLTVVCFLLAGWRRLRWPEVATALGATAAGMLIVKHLTVNALSNTEHLSPVLYLIAKIPWNFLKNLLGLDMWANLYRQCDVPKWQFALHLGPLRAIGACGISSSPPTVTVASGMAAFGLLPLLLVCLRGTALASLRASAAPHKGRKDLLLRFAVIYGGISFLLAPLLGESMGRLFGYSWPLFLVALPLLLAIGGADFLSDWAAATFLALHLGLVWTSYWLGNAHQVMICGLLAYALGWLLLRRTFRAPAVAGGSRNVSTV
jgi:hypothetical protein